MKSEEEIREIYNACHQILNDYSISSKLLEQHLCAVAGTLSYILNFKSVKESEEDIRNITTAMEQIKTAAERGAEWLKKSKK